MKKMVSYMVVGAVSALAVEKYMDNPKKANKLARRTMRLFRK